MIYIVSGPINSGKTSWVLRDFHNYRDADGFACKKVWHEGQHIGYDLFHLRTGLTCPFIRNSDQLPPNWEEAACLDHHYSFSAAGIIFARHITQNAIMNNIKRFYLDEAGPLELSGQGLNYLVEALVGAQIDLVLVVREALVPQIATAFNIKSYTLINPKTAK